MRPGVPWNVKGIEAEAREVAQLAARRAGVSLGEWLSGLIMSDGRVGYGGNPSQSMSQQYQSLAYQPGDGTFGPQPVYQQQPQFQGQPQVAPRPALQPTAPGARYPQAVTPSNVQSFAQPYEPAPYQPQNPHQGYPFGQQQVPQPQQPQYPQGQFVPPTQAPFERPMRGPDYAEITSGLRDLADRFDQSERRAQQAIATVNQSVAAMQDRIDAADRVKQLADAAFTSAADALAQSARDQARAFESMEMTVRSVQKRIGDIEAGFADWPGRESIGRLEAALGQLQKRLTDIDTDRAGLADRDAVARLEATLTGLQRRLSDMETAASNVPGKDALARLEASIAAMHGESFEAERRTRDDITQMAKYMRDLGSRVEAVERGANASQTATQGVAARVDALEARSASIFDEIRGQMSSVDSRLAQVTAAQSAITPGAFDALKQSVEGIAARLDVIGEESTAPLTGAVDAIENTLGVLTSKIEQSDRRSAESVASVNSALKSLSARIEESDKRQSVALGAITQRIEDYDHRAEDVARDIHKSLGDFTERLDASEKRHKDAISGLRMTVDGLVARGVADAVPLDQPGARASRNAGGASYSPPPPPASQDDDVPPFLTGGSRSVQADAPPPPPFGGDELPKPQGQGYSISALQSIMSGPLPQSEGGPADPPFDPNNFEDHLAGTTGRSTLDDNKSAEILAQARRAAKAAAEADAERAAGRKSLLGGQGKAGSGTARLGLIALAGLALVAGIVAVLFTLPGGGDEEGVQRPAPGASIGEMLNGETKPAVPDGAAAALPAATPPTDSFEPLPPPPTEVAPDAEPPVAEAAPAESFSAPAIAPPEPLAPKAGPAPVPAPAVVKPEAAARPVQSTVAALESSAVRGDAKAQFLLSLRYSEGRDVPKDEARAASLATKAAEQGLPVAQYRLGALYERGIGLPKNIGQAKFWYEKSAKSGNRKAMHNLAVLLADTSGGQPNFRDAAQWFRQGAIHGLTDSQYNLAVLLEQGMGVDKNEREAAMWYAIASTQGDTGAGERLEQLKRKLSPADIAMALDAARKYRAKPLDPAANDVPSGPG